MKIVFPLPNSPELDEDDEAVGVTIFVDNVSRTINDKSKAKNNGRFHKKNESCDKQGL
jgi:hypothetical protein